MARLGTAQFDLMEVPLAKSTVVADGFVFPESPRWHAGRLWFSDIQAHRVIAMDESGGHRLVYEFDDEPSGIGFLADDSPLVVLRHQRRIVHLLDGVVDIYVDLKRYSGPGVGSGPPPADYMLNDMVVDPLGRAYVDKFIRRYPQNQSEDLGESLLFVGPDGVHSVAADGLLGPNGIVISPDFRTLTVSETAGKRLTSFSIDSNGSLGNRRLFADLGELVPDGICLDEEGAIWVAVPASQKAMRVLDGGRVTEVISTGDRNPLACVLGGPDRRTLFLATAQYEPGKWSESRGYIESVRVDVCGAGSP